jgi:hypothetical protein
MSPLVSALIAVSYMGAVFFVFGIGPKLFEHRPASKQAK